MRKKILVVGLGNIGKRYIEGILKINEKIDIYLSDINSKNIIKIFKIIKVKNKFKHNFFELNKVKVKKFNLVIVATNSKERFEITKNILNLYNVKNLILEKLLFNKKDEYKKAYNLFKKNKVNAFVNVGQSFISELKNLNLDLEKISKLEVTGLNWGLACNSIHIISIFNEIYKDNQFHFESNSFEKKIFSSKRDGYIEFSGSYNFYHKDSKIASISCKVNERNNDRGLIKKYIVKFLYKKKIIEINYIKKMITIKNDKKVTIKKFYPLKLSVSITKVIKDILITNNCNLPTYKSHYKFAYNYLVFFINVTKKIKNLKNLNNLTIT